MNPLLPRPPDDVVTDHARTHWIDTNVNLEIYSNGDLYEEWALSQCSEPPWLNRTADPEGRRLRMQEAPGPVSHAPMRGSRENRSSFCRTVPSPP